MTDYLKTYYSEEKRPHGDYPLKLAKYLKEEYIGRHCINLVDVGCGRGDFLKAFYDIGFEVQGIDSVESSRDLCKPHTVHVHDIQEEKTDLESNSQDVVFSKSVIEHLNSPETLLKESFRILKPGGKIIIMCPSWIHMGWGPFYQDHTHVTPFTMPSLRDIMKLNGFKKVSVKHFRQLPFIWKYPYLEFISLFISKLPIPYSPMNEIEYNPSLNKLIRFSKEVMLLGVGEKHE